MNLLIINRGFKNFESFEKQKNFLKGKKFYLINLTNNNLKLPKWMDFEFIDISSNIYSEYQNQKHSLKKKFINNLRDPELLEYKFSEINYADEIWKIYFISLTVKSFIKKKKIKELLLFSSNRKNYLYFSLKKFTRIKFNHFYSVDNFYFNFQNILKTYLIYFNNFFQEFILSIIFIFIKKNNFYNDRYIYSNFPNHWDLKKKYYKLFDKNNQNVYLISILRNNSSLLKHYKNFFLLKSLDLKKINILESYNSPLDIISIYSKNLFSLNKKKSKTILEKLGLNFFLNDIERNYRLIEKSKNISFYNSIKHVYKKKKFEKIFFPFFEFIDGRLIAKFCNKLNIITYGFQHSFLLANTYSRFFDATQIIHDSNLNNYLPKKIFTESYYITKKFSHFKKLKVYCYGSFRLRNIKKIDKRKKSNNFLFVMDLHNKVYLENIIKTHKENSEINLYIRPHPTFYDEYKHKSFPNKNLKIDLYKNIYDSVIKNNIEFVLISSSTSTFIDLIKTNLKIIIFKVPNYIRDDYMLDKHFFSINNIDLLEDIKVNHKMNIKKLKKIFLPPQIKKNFLISL